MRPLKKFFICAMGNDFFSCFHGRGHIYKLLQLFFGQGINGGQHFFIAALLVLLRSQVCGFALAAEILPNWNPWRSHLKEFVSTG